MSDMATELQIRPITVAEYKRMSDAGIIDEDERIELLGGMLVALPPFGEGHIFAHERIVRYLIERFGDRLLVAGQASLPLTRIDEPQPDVTLFLPETAAKPKSRWTISDVVALLEISDTSLRRDRGPKLRAYARGMVAEYIIVDIRNRRLIRYRDPLHEKYQTVEEFEPGQSFTLLGFPDVSLEVAEFFGP
jgi:Uma2 family endonuclease